MADELADRPADRSVTDALSALRDHDPTDWRRMVEPALAKLREPRARTLGVIGGALVAVVLLAGGVALVVARSTGASRDERPGAPSQISAMPFATTTSRPAEVTVHAAGALVSPGLYHLRGSPRVADLVDAAGGLAPDADIDRINLAAPLSDGVRLYVPRRGETGVPPVLAGSGAPGGGSDPGASGPSGSSGPTPSSPIDLNNATAEQLDTLPGVGPATAAAIVEYRRQHGPFRSVDDLVGVRGIGPAKLDAIRALVHT